jgi:hypothetical protein
MLPTRIRLGTCTHLRLRNLTANRALNILRLVEFVSKLGAVLGG